MPGESVFISPLLAAAALSLPPALDQWAIEPKFDGMRAVLAIHRGKVKIWSKTGRDVTRGFPELAALAEHAGRRTLILDGVIFAARRLSDYCPPDKLAVVEDTMNPIGP